MNFAIILPILSFLAAGIDVDINKIPLSLREETYYRVIDAKDISLLKKDTYAVPDNVPPEIERLLIRYAAKYALPLDVVVRLSEVESNHGAYKQSHHPNFDGSFDIGVLALNSNYSDYFSWRYFEGNPEDFDPHIPEHNIQTGLAYLAHLNGLTGDMTSAVIAYNCGYRTLQEGKIPLSTQRYVRAVINGEPL